MKKRLLSFVVCALCVMLFSITAFAGILGGKWTSNPTYYISSSNAYYTAVTNAASSWNSALSSISSSIRINTASATSAVVSIVTNAYGATGWNAMGEPGPDIYSGTYTYATMRINTTYMDTYSATKKKAICTHEFGHILGLAHNTYSSPQTLMYVGGSSVYFDSWGISAPEANDVSDLDSIY